MAAETNSSMDYGNRKRLKGYTMKYRTSMTEQVFHQWKKDVCKEFIRCGFSNKAMKTLDWNAFKKDYYDVGYTAWDAVEEELIASV